MRNPKRLGTRSSHNPPHNNAHWRAGFHPGRHQYQRPPKFQKASERNSFLALPPYMLSECMALGTSVAHFKRHEEPAVDFGKNPRALARQTPPNPLTAPIYFPQTHARCPESRTCGTEHVATGDVPAHHVYLLEHMGLGLKPPITLTAPIYSPQNHARRPRSK